MLNKCSKFLSSKTVRPELVEGLTTNVICIVDRNLEQLFSWAKSAFVGSGEDCKGGQADVVVARGRQGELVVF